MSARDQDPDMDVGALPLDDADEALLDQLVASAVAEDPTATVERALQTLKARPRWGPVVWGGVGAVALAAVVLFAAATLRPRGGVEAPAYALLEVRGQAQVRSAPVADGVPVVSKGGLLTVTLGPDTGGHPGRDVQAALWHADRYAPVPVRALDFGKVEVRISSTLLRSDPGDGVAELAVGWAGDSLPAGRGEGGWQAWEIPYRVAP